MNNIRVKDFLDQLLDKYEQTPSLLEQKEELITHLTERVEDHMAKGLTYDQAFNATIRDLGDVNALVADIAPIKAKSDYYSTQDSSHGFPHGHERGFSHDHSRSNSNAPTPWEGTGTGTETADWPHHTTRRPRFKIHPRTASMLTSMSVFVYVILGILSPWPQWWAWGWIIIPLSSLLFIPNFKVIFVSATPFIFILLGMFFGWWAWAWVIIPLASLTFIPDWRVVLASAMPFVYVLLGLFFGWWAWAWIIIPMSGLVFIGFD